MSYEAYKANRAEMPEDLVTQMPYIIRVCEALNIPILRHPGYEADDIIGTMAHLVADSCRRSSSPTIRICASWFAIRSSFVCVKIRRI